MYSRVATLESEEAMRRGDEALNAMTPGGGGTRTSVSGRRLHDSQASAGTLGDYVAGVEVAADEGDGAEALRPPLYRLWRTGTWRDDCGSLQG
jgi:hypothetical protein